MECPVFGISRHRIATDGEGVTTLVAFHRCTLHCHYCLNPQSLDPTTPCQVLTPEALLDATLIDNLYFLATGGGITFGGGEPALRHDFILRFREICPPEWKLFIETSLNVPRANVEALTGAIDHFIVDVKDTHPAIYHAYTSGDVERVLSNLRYLADKGLQEQVTLRLPLIPEYNTEADIDKSEQCLREMGFTLFDRFEYLTPEAIGPHALKKRHDAAKAPKNP